MSSHHITQTVQEWVREAELNVPTHSPGARQILLYICAISATTGCKALRTALKWLHIKNASLA